MTTLKLETRGCDFRPNSEEAKLSDLGNYRLCGTIKSDLYDAPRGRVGDYFIEICSNIQHNKFRNGMYSFFRNCYYTADGMCYGDLAKDGQTDNPTKAGLLEYINNTFKTNYTDIEIVDRLKELHD